MTDLNKLKTFANTVIQAALEGGNWDGCEIQELAEELGLLEGVKVTEPCGEECGCCELDAWPTTCYRKTDLLKLSAGQP